MKSNAEPKETLEDTEESLGVDQMFGERDAEEQCEREKDGQQRG